MKKIRIKHIYRSDTAKRKAAITKKAALTTGWTGRDIYRRSNKAKLRTKTYYIYLLLNKMKLSIFLVFLLSNTLFNALKLNNNFSVFAIPLLLQLIPPIERSFKHSAIFSSQKKSISSL